MTLGPFEGETGESDTHPLFEVTTTGTGRVAVVPTTSGQSVVHVISPTGVMESSTLGITARTDVTHTGIETTADDQTWLFQRVNTGRASTPPHRTWRRWRWERVFSWAKKWWFWITKRWSVTVPDGSGGTWVSFHTEDRYGHLGSRYVQHLAADGTTRWPRGGVEFGRGRFARFEALGPDSAIAIGGGIWYVHEMTTSDWGPSPILLPHDAARILVRRGAQRNLTILWQRYWDEIRSGSAALDSLAGAVIWGKLALPKNNVSRLILATTGSGALGGVLVWRQPPPAHSNRAVRGEIRALPEKLLPVIYEPKKFDVWAEGERATAHWQSAEQGTLDVDLSIDDGTTWLPWVPETGPSASAESKPWARRLGSLLPVSPY